MTVAFIPVRGGSKSIPLKNIKEMAGKPLVYWAVKAACDCPAIDRVYVSTDSEVIKDKVCKLQLAKAEVVDRSADTASDTASTEAAMLEFAEAHEFDDIVLIQATSPLLTGDDLAGGIRLYRTQGTDSVLSVVEQKRFYWSIDEAGIAAPVNYDYYSRPRRQEFSGSFVENGAFYITGKDRLMQTGSRISGRIRAYVMPEDTYFEIDEPSDWIISEKLLESRLRAGRGKKEIKIFLTDCDGCLTDGGMYYSEQGDELKKFNAKDGMGFRLLSNNGIKTGIITGEDRALNKARAKKIKADEIYQGISDKLSVVKKICEKYGVDLSETAYVGDDCNDLECLKAVGFSACPADASEEVKEQADYVAKRKGGDGAVREIIEKIIGGKW